VTEVCTIDWHVTPFRAEPWLELWEPAAARVLAFGATSWSLTRAIDDPLHFTQTSVWESREDFERYWFSEEIAAVREQVLGYHDLPVQPAWHTLVASE
jgi:quinol monooxygenase YgiN